MYIQWRRPPEPTVYMSRVSFSLVGVGGSGMGSVGSSLWPLRFHNVEPDRKVYLDWYMRQLQ